MGELSANVPDYGSPNAHLPSHLAYHNRAPSPLLLRFLIQAIQPLILLPHATAARNSA